MNAPWLAVTAAIIAVLVTACASSQPSGGPTVSTPELSDGLLDAGSLGGGWQETETGEPEDDRLLKVCEAEVLDGAGASSVALRAFQQGVNVFVHALMMFPHEDEARAEVAAMRAATSDCDRWTDDDGLSWSLEAMNDVPNSDDVVAIRTTTQGGVEGEERIKITTAYTTDYIVWHRGRVVSMLAYAYTGAAPEFAEDMYEAADRRLEQADLE